MVVGIVIALIQTSAPENERTWRSCWLTKEEVRVAPVAQSFKFIIFTIKYCNVGFIVKGPEVGRLKILSIIDKR